MKACMHAWAASACGAGSILDKVEMEDEVCDDQELNEPPNDDIKEPQAGSSHESDVQVPDLVLDNDSICEDDPVPDLLSDSDSDDQTESETCGSNKSLMYPISKDPSSTSQTSSL